MSPDAPHRDFLDGDAVQRLVASYLRQPGEELARLVFAVLLLDSWLSVLRRASRPVAARSSPPSSLRPAHAAPEPDREPPAAAARGV